MDVSFRSFLCAKENGQDFASFSTLEKVREITYKGVSRVVDKNSAKSDMFQKLFVSLHHKRHQFE